MLLPHVFRCVCYRVRNVESRKNIENIFSARTEPRTWNAAPVQWDPNLCSRPVFSYVGMHVYTVL